MQVGSAEAASLMRWLGFYAASEQEQCLVIVNRLLDTAFPAAFEEKKDLCGWEAVVATLEGFYEASVPVDVRRLEEASIELNGTLRTVVELVLGAVVQCEEKDMFVKDILTMEDAVQADLMTIIEKVMARGVSVVEESSDEGAHVVETEEKKEKEKIQSSEKESPGLGSPLYLSRNAALEQMKRENGVLKEENVHLARELESKTKKFRGVEDEKMKLVEMIRQLKEQLGSDVLRKERSVHALYNERLQALQRELDNAKAELQEKTVLATKVPALQDEVDLLRPLAVKMAKMDTTVTKYKAKIDELSGAKDTLRRLEGTNTELLEKNLALESELDKAASWRRRLKEAKEANTVVEFRVSELKSLLAQKKQELVVARADLDAAHSSLHEINALNAQLQELVGKRLSDDTTERSNTCSAPALTGGVSEFNPELMQKLTRLEYENIELKEQVDGETAARIEGLLDEIEDTTRLKKSFEMKYFDTQQVLQSTQSELKRAKHSQVNTTEELQTRINQLTRMSECSAMQVEDANSDILRLQQLKAHELKEMCHRYEEQAVDTIERINLLVAAKSSEIEQLASRLHQDKVKHNEERQELETANLVATTELEKYQELHSVSNADWCAKEGELSNRVLELEELCSKWKQQEQVLKATIKSQLQSNGRIVQKNKALKAGVIDKREAIAVLEATVTRLESKLALLEKERAYFSTQEEQKRDAGGGISSFSSQLSTQVSLVVSELEKVLKENKELNQQLVGCRCGRKSPPRGAASDSAQKAKNYYVSRIHQLERSQQQGEHKRRELLLVNAKLIQEQKQLHVKNMSLVNEVHELEESVNHCRLREERRKKKGEQPSLPVETKYKFTSPRSKKARTKDQSRNSDSLAKKNSDKLQKVSREVLAAALASGSGDTHNLLGQDNAARSSTRKRKLEEDFAAQETASATNSTATRNKFTEASAFFSKPSAPPSTSAAPESRSKRRFSHFITRRSASTKQQPDKPSECQQQ